MSFKVGDEVKRNSASWGYGYQDCIIQGQNGEITRTTGVITEFSKKKHFDCVVRWKNGFNFYYKFTDLEKVAKQLELFDI